MAICDCKVSAAGCAAFAMMLGTRGNVHDMKKKKKMNTAIDAIADVATLLNRMENRMASPSQNDP